MKRISLFKDARDYQILFLFTFLILGVWSRDFTVHFDAMVTVLIACLLTQALSDRFYASLHPDITYKFSLRSAWITGISLCLLLRTNSLTVIALAGSLSILSKFVFRLHGKHFFNPSNFGIIAVMVLTSNAWVSPGQWGQDTWYAFLFLAAGGMVVRKVGRWDTTGAFLLTYGGLEAWRNSWLGWTWDVFLNRMTSAGLLLFAFFMITDPRAIPDNRYARILWAILVAILSYVLRNKFFMPTAILWALFVLSPLTVLFDWIWPASRFTWDKSETKEIQPQLTTVPRPLSV
jgi:Na+-transporting NADH:ubiquinone oxidoreductase subunit NqrB